MAEFIYVIGVMLLSDDFSGDLSNWVAEGGRPQIVDGKMDLDTPGGSTVWFEPRLYGNVLIEYDVTVIDKGGPNDRVSDLNCFWMGIDPDHPDDLFAESGNRAGEFRNYDGLHLYYVGYGGNNNSTTRFRRYHGGERELLAEHTDKPRLITPNHKYHIQLVLFDNIAEFWRDGERLFRYEDTEPYRQGHFGLRTVRNHLAVENFRVMRIHPGYGKREGAEKVEYRDEETGAHVVRLTKSDRNDKHSYYDSPAFSPDGEYIVFSSAEPDQKTGDMYLVNPDGTDMRRLAGAATFNMHTGSLPWWSPDSKHILYNARVKGEPFVGRVSIDALELEFQPGRLRSLSPDGTQVVYQTAEEFFVVDLRTNEQRKIADLDDMLALSPHQDEIARQRPHFQNPKWRPDGQELMTGISNEGKGRRTTVKELYLLKPDGSNLRRLCDYRHHHSWTPDGKQILFNGTDEEGKQQLYLIDASGKTPRERVLEGFDGGGHPIMSPDMRWIVTDVFGGQFRDSLVIIDMQTREFRKLVNVLNTHGRSHESGTHPHPSWSPDSKWVIYDSDETGTCQVYLVRVEQEM